LRHREGYAVSLAGVHADLEGVPAGVRQRNIEDQHGASLYISHARGWLTELHRSLSIEEFGPFVINEPDSERMLADLGSPAANPKYQVRARMHGRKLWYPYVLKKSQHGELPLLVDQGVVSEYREIELQESGHPNGGHYVSLPNLVHHIHSFRDLPEHRVLAVEVALRRMTNEELAPASVLPSVRHRKGPGHVLMSVPAGFALDGIAGAPGSDPRVLGILRQGIPALDHEIRDHPVKAGAVVKLLIGQFLEILDGLGRLLAKQLCDDGALAGFERSGLHD